MPFVNSPDEVREGRGRRGQSTARGTHRVPGQGDPRKERPRAQRGARPARPLRPGPDLPRRHRPADRPHQDQRRRARQRPGARRPGDRCRPRPEHRRQAADPGRPRTPTRGRSSPSTSASGPSPRPWPTSAARSPRGRAATSTGAMATTPSQVVHELIDEVRAAATTPDPRHRRRHAGHRRPDRHDPLGRQPRLAGPAARPDPPGAPRPPDRRRQRQPRRRLRDVPVQAATSARRTWSSSRSAAASAPAWSCATSCSAVTARRPARSATSSSIPTATPATAAGSAASRPWRARRRSCKASRRDQPRRRSPPGPPPATTDALGVVRTAGRPLGGAIAHLVGALDVRQHHARRHGHRARRAMARGRSATRPRGRSLAATGRETTIEDGGTGEDVTLLGACALLLTRELGLTVHR